MYDNVDQTDFVPTSTCSKHILVWYTQEGSDEEGYYV